MKCRWFTRDNPQARAMREWLALQAYAETKLGRRGWNLLRGYGRLKSGPYSGRYVSALPAPLARDLVDSLVGGEEVPVHLMHRHVSGAYRSSGLRLVVGRLWMVYDDVAVLA